MKRVLSLLLVLCMCVCCVNVVDVDSKEKLKDGVYSAILANDSEEVIEWYEYYKTVAKKNKIGILTKAKYDEKTLVLCGKLSSKKDDTVKFTKVKNMKLKISKDLFYYEYEFNGTKNYLDEYNNNKTDGKVLIFEVKNGYVVKLGVSESLIYTFAEF